MFSKVQTAKVSRSAFLDYNYRIMTTTCTTSFKLYVFDPNITMKRRNKLEKRYIHIATTKKYRASTEWPQKLGKKKSAKVKKGYRCGNVAHMANDC